MRWYKDIQEIVGIGVVCADDLLGAWVGAKALYDDRWEKIKKNALTGEPLQTEMLEE